MDWERFFVVGPTASGKSDLALHLAQKHSGHIVNADSLQFFKDLKVGTAYPSDQDFKSVPHHLFGICNLGEEFTAGEFVRQYHKFEDQLISQEASIENGQLARPLFIVGGSGFYIKALDTGMFPVAQDSMDADLPREHEGWSKQEKVAFLESKDPKYLEKIGINDVYRMDRAIQLFLAEGKTMTQFHVEMLEQQSAQKEEGAPTFALKMGVYVERDELLKRVKLRTQKMLQNGLVEEVQSILPKVSADWKPIQSVGYKETVSYLQNQTPSNLDELSELIIKNTMNLAKRQMTWFRADSEVVWFHSQKDLIKAQTWLEAKLEQFSE